MIVGNFGTICCADDFFVEDGEYKFDPSKLPQAHKKCKEDAEMSMQKNFSPVLIANTNTSEWEFADYEQLAEKYGYRVFHVIVENRHGNANTHNVPEEILEKQKQKLKSSIKL